MLKVKHDLNFILKAKRPIKGSIRNIIRQKTGPNYAKSDIYERKKNSPIVIILFLK